MELSQPDLLNKKPRYANTRTISPRIFKKQAIEFNNEPEITKQDQYIYVRNEYACFHTNLYTKNYKAIYACFDRNKKHDTLRDWFFRGFFDDSSPWMKYIEPLPQKPSYYMTQGVNYNPELSIRVNVEHILGDAENLERLPAEIRTARNLPLLLETGVELARRKAVVEPNMVVPQGYQGQVQFLLPICLMDMQQPDLAMTLTIMDGYYLGNTCLTLEMAYLNARLLARPLAPWLTALTK